MPQVRRPDLTEEPFEALLRHEAEDSGGQVRLAVAASLALHQDELNVVLDDGVGLIGLAQEAAGSPIDLVRGVRDLVPDDRRQVVESQTPATFLDRRVQRDDGVTPVVLAPGETYISHDADEAPTGHESFVAHAPDLIESIKKLVVVLDPPQLAVGAAVLLERPVGRRGDHEVHGPCGEGRKAGISQQQPMTGRNLKYGQLDRGHRGRLLREPRQVTRRVAQVSELLGDEGVEQGVRGHPGRV